jgi:excisionase family DNA binding protein
MQETTLLNRSEAADALRISTRTLDNKVKDGEIGHVRIGDGRGRVLFRPCDLEAFAARHVRPAKRVALCAI